MNKENKSNLAVEEAQPVLMTEEPPAAKTGRRRLWFALAGLFFLLIPVLIFTKAGSPIPAVGNGALVFICLSLLGFCLGMGVRRTWLKVAAFCLVAVFAAFTVVEVYLSMGESAAPLRQDESTYTTGEGIVIDQHEVRAMFEQRGIQTSPDAVTSPHMNVGDDLLGYRLLRGVDEILDVKLAGTERGDDIVYMATYHLGADGWRVTPQNPEATKAVVLLGDSFTFGLGLNDGDTFPWQAALELGSDYQVFNYGVPGWGTHQVLAMVENGWFDEICDSYERVYFFYTPIDHHKERLFGEAFWDQEGPCYDLLPDGTVQYLGPFSSAKTEREQSSRLLGKLGEEQYKQDLMMAMVRQINRAVKEKQGAEFILLRAIYACEFLNALAAEDIPVLHEDLAPVEDYVIAGDGHPNAKGAKVFAGQVADYIQGK